MNKNKNHKIKTVIILLAIIFTLLIFTIAFSKQIHLFVLQIPNITENALNQKNVCEQNKLELETVDTEINNSFPISSVREDFLRYQDKDYANFRALKSLGIKDGVIYRSSSPIDNFINRAMDAGIAMKEQNIRYIINLDDNKDQAKSKLEQFNNLENKNICQYYQNQNVLYAPISANLCDLNNKEQIKKIFEFINNANGPILIHCSDGQDKTGFVCFLISCLACSSFDYVKADYFQSQYCLRKILNNQETKILRDQIDKKFRYLVCGPIGLSAQSMLSANLNLYVKNYLYDCGLSDDVVQNVYKKVINFNENI